MIRLNPRQFTQPMLDPSFERDYPIMPAGGTTQGDPVQPLYRAMSVRHDDSRLHQLSQPRLGGRPDDAEDLELVEGLLGRATRPRSHATGGVGHNLGIHWTHDREFLTGGGDGYPWLDEPEGAGTTNVIWEADHPGRGGTMSWDNEDDSRTMNATIVDEKYRDMASPEVPVRPGTDLSMRGVHVQDEAGNWRRIAFAEGARA